MLKRIIKIKYWHYILFFLAFISLRIILWEIYGTYMNPGYIIDGREFIIT
jgi:hypothetical protein